MEHQHLALAILVAVLSFVLVLPSFLGGMLLGAAFTSAFFGAYLYLSRAPDEHQPLPPDASSIVDACFPPPPPQVEPLEDLPGKVGNYRY